MHTSKLNKYSFSITREAIEYDSKWNDIENAIRANIENNVDDIKKLFSNFTSGVFSIENWNKYFSLTGSLKVNSLDILKSSKNYFIIKPHRYFEFSNSNKTEIHLRGPRYIAAIDPQLSVQQVLNIYYEDINDGIMFLYNYRYDNYHQYFELLPILDYIKNAFITIYNAFTHREKIGDLELNNQEYQKNKSQLLELVNHSVICYYLSMINNLTKRQLQDFLGKVNMGFVSKIIRILLSEYKELKFSSRTMVRPEAAHPVLLGAFAFNMVHKFPEVKIVFGLPSGGTEIACLIHMYYKYIQNRDNQLVMLPISIHTAKKDFDKPRRGRFKIKKYIPRTKYNKNTINALLVDDNSSTGTTISLSSKLITTTNNTINLECGVVEADILRTKLRHINPNNKYKIAHPDLYKYSVGILPISKIIHKKYDLKELKECRLLSKHYSTFISPESLVQRIKREVIIDSIENKYEYLLDIIEPTEAIHEFKHSKLSNFYGVQINYKKNIYPSVEHAYLCQKYNLNDLKSLRIEYIRELNQIFKLKGINKEIRDFSNIFFDSDMPAGVVKRMSNKLKNWGYQKESWDEERLELMIELQLIKFSDPEMNEYLFSTGNKYLIEGNTWNDTYWGISNNKGKNYLGRIIMNIREKYYSKEIKKPIKSNNIFNRFIGKSPL